MTVTVQTWRLTPARWPGGARMRIVILSDIHACWPWMTPARVGRIVDQAQGLGGDLVLLLGDYPGHIFPALPVDAADVTAQLARLTAPLGVFAVFGNHDWYDEPDSTNSADLTLWHRRFTEAGIEVLENRFLPLATPSGEISLAGLGSQRAFKRKLRAARCAGVDDLQATLSDAPPDRFTILLAHEPDIFARLPDHVDLTLSGHTHGGQIRLGNWMPVVPSAYGARYAYGHVTEAGRDLVVSGGLGCSGLPIRLGRPPELTVVELG